MDPLHVVLALVVLIGLGTGLGIGLYELADWLARKRHG
jgi:hypothetical protein